MIIVVSKHETNKTKVSFKNLKAPGALIVILSKLIYKFRAAVESKQILLHFGV